MLIKPPQIDPRRYSEMLQQIRSLIPFYTPEWTASDDNDFGQALLHIFSHLTEDVISHLNRAPRKNFIAFLSMLGIELLPSRPARVPVRFIPAPGTESGFRIPENTRLAAGATEQRPEELPFETEENLFAIRSALLNVVAVDPQNDAIFLPPLGFSELQLPAVPLPTYSFVSFAGAGSNTFQLDRVEGLEENDLLRIPPSNSSSEPDQNSSEALPPSSAEHLVVSATSGNIVTTIDKISRDYPANTKVEKVTRFHLFDSKDWQEHVLYLGHPDLFSIKNEAQFTVNVVHLAGTSAGIEPLNLAWEYWGEREGREEKDWWEFDIEGDGSAGFSRDGYIVLTKGKGEIKETELNGVSSRWIRCRLKDKIPSTEPIKLPNLDHIKFLIESTGDPVPADQGFYNDTPLDVNLEFFPFGTEPRMLDRFNIASEEIFSKKTAEIKLKIDVAGRGVLKTPTAAIFKTSTGKHIFKVFSRGTGGRLLEAEIDPLSNTAGIADSDWKDHGLPPDTFLADSDAQTGSEAQPTAVSELKDPTTKYIWVFARADNGHLVERSYQQGLWRWLDHKTPPSGVGLKSDPIAVKVGEYLVNVYVVGEDDNLYTLCRSAGLGGKWLGSGIAPPGLKVDSAPYAVSCPKNGAVEVQVFVKATNNNLWMWNGASWKQYEPDSTDFFMVDSRPFAQCYADNSSGTSTEIYAKVFVKDDAGNLRELHTKTDNWQNLNSPTSSGGDPIAVVSNPHGFVEYPADPSDDNSDENKHIFVIGADQQLWERTDGDGNAWASHPLNSGIQLNHSPFVIPASSENSFGYSVFAETNSSSFVERRIKTLSLNSGKLATDAENATIQFDGGSDEQDAYKGALITVAVGSQPLQTRKIIAYKGSTKTATVDKSWDAGSVPDTSSTFDVATEQQGSPTAVGTDTITLSDTASANKGFYNELDITITSGPGAGEIRKITDYDGINKTATLNTPWDASAKPDTTSDYQIGKLGGTSLGGQNATLELASGASPIPDEYNLKYVRISAGIGTGQRRLIDVYDGPNRKATLDASWFEIPDTNSFYQVLASSSLESWNEYTDIFEESLSPDLSWEYWNSMGWVAFTQDDHKLKDTTNNLLKSGTVKFELPSDIESTEVAGQENFWIRSRIISGDYGQQIIEMVTTDEGNQRVVFNKSSLRPPKITKLTIRYKLLEEQFPISCLTFNNLNYIDQTDACQTASKWFSPFVKLEDIVKTIYLGFEDSVEGSPIKLLFAAKELKYTEEQKPKLTWSFRTNNKWEQVSSEDATDGLIRQEILQLQIPRGFEKFSIFGQSRFWIKGSLSKGRYDELPVLSGVFPNTTWTMQAETIQNEILGSSNGEEKQDFQFNKVSVLGGEKVRVLEVLSQEETAQLLQDVGPNAIKEIKDDFDRVIGTWVLWKKVPYFFDSKPEDRHYKLDRALGRLEFGDGVHGQIPPAGQDNIRAFSYQAGGGAAGNILAGEIQTLSTAIAGVESVINPVAADGGADKATIEEMLDIGPGMISHRHRAVTIEDFELLAVEASRKIKKVRCLPNINNNRQPETGWVTVIIVPESKDDQPQPSLVLRREVQRFLAERCDGPTADRGRVNVIGPVYKPINVEVDIYAESIDVASEAEGQARDKLKKFFHPMTGGPEGNGWDFGRGLAASDIYVLLEGIPGVDHIENLKFVHDSQENVDIVQIAPHSLLSSGNLEINMRTAENV